jgi:hypothetical protein
MEMCFERAAIDVFHYESVVLVQIINETHHVGMLKASESMEVLYFSVPHFIIHALADLDGTLDALMCR